jgi:hypothetical protein
VVGPSVVNYIREYQLAHGVPKADAYDSAMYVMAALLVLGFICNLLVRPVAEHNFMSEQELAAEKRLAHERDAAMGARAGAGSDGVVGVSGGAAVATAAPVAAGGMVTLLAWAVVGIPLLIGVWITLQKAIVLFR